MRFAPVVRTASAPTTHGSHIASRTSRATAPTSITTSSFVPASTPNLQLRLTPGSRRLALAASIGALVLAGAAYAFGFGNDAAEAAGGSAAMVPLMMHDLPNLSMRTLRNSLRFAWATAFGRFSGNWIRVAQSSSDPTDRQIAIRRLMQTPHPTPATRHALVTALNAPDEMVSCAAAEGLYEVGDASCVPALEARLAAEPGVGSLCRINLQAAIFRWKYADAALSDALQNNDTQAQTLVCELFGKKFVQQQLTTLFSASDDSARLAVLRLLENNLEQIRGTAAKLQLYGLVLPLTADPHRKIRLAATTILGQIRYYFLQSQLDDSEGDAPSQRNLDKRSALRARLDDHLDIAAVAAHALPESYPFGETPPETDRVAWRSVWQRVTLREETTDWSTARAAAAEALANDCRPEDIDRFRELAHDSNPAVRAAVVCGLCTLPTPAALATVIDIALGDADSAIRLAAKYFLDTTLADWRNLTSAEPDAQRQNDVLAMLRMWIPDVDDLLVQIMRGNDTAEKILFDQTITPIAQPTAPPVYPATPTALWAQLAAANFAPAARLMRTWRSSVQATLTQDASVRTKAN